MVVVALVVAVIGAALFVGFGGGSSDRPEAAGVTASPSPSSSPSVPAVPAVPAEVTPDQFCSAFLTFVDANSEFTKWCGHWKVDLDGINLSDPQAFQEVAKASAAAQMDIDWGDSGPIAKTLDPWAIRDSAASFPWRTCTGCDLHPRHMMHLGREAYQWLAIIYMLCESCHQ